MESALAAAADDATAAAAVHVVAAAVGFASTILLWLSILVGILLSRSWSLSWMKHTTIKTTHMSLAILGLSLGVVHGAAQLAAPGTYVRVIDEFIPFLNPTKPIGVGLGTLALLMFLALGFSVPIQRRLGHSRWRMVHSTAYMAYTVTVGHLVFTGSEVKGWVTWATVISWLITIGLWLAVSPRFATKISAATESYVTAKANQTTVNVNPHACARFGFCEHEAPEVFQLRGTGRLAYRANVEPHEVDAVYQAMRVCPARAITMDGPGVPFDLRQPPGAPGVDAPVPLGATAPGRPEERVAHLAPVSPVSTAPPPPPVSRFPTAPTSPAVTALPPVPAGAGAPRPTARLGPFPPGGPGRRHGQPVEPPPPPPLRAVPPRDATGEFERPRFDNVTGLRPRGGA